MCVRLKWGSYAYTNLSTCTKTDISHASYRSQATGEESVPTIFTHQPLIKAATRQTTNFERNSYVKCHEVTVYFFNEISISISWNLEHHSHCARAPSWLVSWPPFFDPSSHITSFPAFPSSPNRFNTFHSNNIISKDVAPLLSRGQEEFEIPAESDHAKTCFGTAHTIPRLRNRDCSLKWASDDGPKWSMSPRVVYYSCQLIDWT